MRPWTTVLLFVAASLFTPERAAAGSCTTPSFGPPHSHRLPSYPREMATADFNADGRADVAVAQVLMSRAEILLGNGDGTFTAAPPATTGPGPVRLAVGDFNEDGKADLASANWHTDTVTILLGNGDGTFAGTDHQVGEDPEGVAVADFNGDGNQDVVATVDFPGSAAVLLGNGTGGFAPVQRYSTGIDPSDVAVADFDLDGDADLVVSRQADDDVVVLLGNGDGTFATRVPYAAARNPWAVSVADFDRDGRTDVAVAYFGGVAVLRGLGNGALGPPLLIERNGDIRWVQAADAGGDGTVDLVAANAAAGQAELILGVGDGTFLTPVPYPTPGSAWFVMLADLNGDGRLDLVAGDSGGLTTRLATVCVARYFTVPPCRLLDTRDAPGPSGGPALDANSSRDFPVTGRCLVPATAKAAALNLVAVNPTDQGNLRAYPTGTPTPAASILNFAAGRTRANFALLALGADGKLTVRCDMPPGSTGRTHFVLDVAGYFE